MNHFRNNIVYLFIILLVASSCDLIKMKEDPTQETVKANPVARVGENYLYPEDLEGIATSGMSIEDSTERTMRFVNNWIRKQLLIGEAATRIEFDEAEIERKILDYRYSLMGYEYQSYYINQNLNMEVDDAEIESYYNENIDNFILKQNIIRGRFIKLPTGAPKMDRVKTLLNSTREENIEELNSYALSFAATYQLNDSVWMVFDEVIKNSPLAEIPNKVQFLQSNRYIETADVQFRYFLKILEYRISDNTSPLEFVKEDIKNIIINKRKVQLAQQLEEDVYERATKNKEFEIY
ncbi:peptidyl-prolyl cis-trans isomerase [Fulvivirga lutimaris]|uniref:peptidylprolyl isomerase n=1 Tax=Fulvivirga lutimaris TaxID=1819566 RepID=UPI0012BD6457|nr:peptidylprolyl isomerase [Fulvivirga lutimaris]MTI39813.1 peptidyl-prolyl cis-trans isomerase [Fulvivirga lutimaris]